MSGILRRRVGAVFLLAFFVGSRVGLPELDVVLYHTATDAAPAGAPHVERPGGCGAHSEHCVLATFASVRQPALVSQQLIRVEPVSRDYAVFHVVWSPRSVDRSLFQPSRAPPVPAS